MLQVGQHAHDVATCCRYGAAAIQTLPLLLLAEPDTVLIEMGLSGRSGPDQAYAIANEHHIVAGLIVAERFRDQSVVQQAAIGMQLIALDIAAQTPVFGRIRLVCVGVLIIGYILAQIRVIHLHLLAVFVGDERLVANKVHGNQLAIDGRGAALGRLARAVAFLAAIRM